MDKPLNFPEVSFTETPTASQIAQFFEDVHRFTNLIMGRIMAAGDATVNEQKIATALNGVGMLVQSAEMWKNSSPIAQARGMQMPPDLRRN